MGCLLQSMPYIGVTGSLCLVCSTELVWIFSSSSYLRHCMPPHIIRSRDLSRLPVGAPQDAGWHDILAMLSGLDGNHMPCAPGQRWNAACQALGTLAGQACTVLGGPDSWHYLAASMDTSTGQ